MQVFLEEIRDEFMQADESWSKLRSASSERPGYVSRLTHRSRQGSVPPYKKFLTGLAKKDE
jgi:hypothetical protein